MLDTFKIDGFPLGDCLVADVRRYATQRAEQMHLAARDVAFLRNICANLPGNARIRQFWRGSDADDLLRRANADHGL